MTRTKKFEDLSIVGTARWREKVPKHLQAPFAKALDYMEKNDLANACWWFGETCNKCQNAYELRPVLFFGGQVAGHAWLELRGRDADHPDLGEWREIAHHVLSGSVQAFPDDPVARHNLGRFLQDAGDIDGAIECYKHTALIDPTQVETWGNMADLLYGRGDRAGAFKCWERAVSLPADKASARMSQAYYWLRIGEYMKGWAAFNDRWKDSVFARGYGRDKELGGIHWLGQKLPRNAKLFVHGEQGLGDHVMFARYVPLLLARGIRVVGLETRATLVRWMEASYPDVPIIDRASSERPAFTHQCSTMDLPGILGTTPETIPPPIAPSVTIDCDGIFTNDLRVGIVWEGAKGNTADAIRSIPAEELRHLANIPGVTWVNLQFSPHGALIANAWLGAIDGTVGCNDVLDTAAVMRGLDLVVTVDSLPLHLAGSLGVPTLALHRYCREWRWRDSGEQNVWYPSVTDLTQSAPGNWTELLQRARQKISALVGPDRLERLQLDDSTATSKW